jgi:hypothetical protein
MRAAYPTGCRSNDFRQGNTPRLFAWIEPLRRRWSRNTQTIPDIVEFRLDAFHVLRIHAEDPMLGAEQKDGLEYQPQPLILPVLQCAGEELTQVAAPFERLPVRLLVGGVLGKLREELPIQDPAKSKRST